MSEGLHRLFFGIPVPETVASHFATLSLSDGLRRVAPRNFHITLLFLGDVPSQKIPELRQAAGQITFAPFDVTLNGYGCFPEKGRPNVIWAGFSPNDELHGLRDRLADKIRETGIPFDNKPWHPHITIARNRNADGRETRNTLASFTLPELADFRIGRFILYESELRREGAVYNQRFQFPAD